MNNNRLLMMVLTIVWSALTAVSCDKDHNGTHIDISPKTEDHNNSAQEGSQHKGPRAIYIGDSITWQWGTTPREIAKSKIVIPLEPLPSFLTDRGNNVLVTWHPGFFSGNDYLDMGISAENTTQMLARYQKDVLDKDPSCVVIMGGTNDLAQGVSKSAIMSNLKAMAERAAAGDIKVILCSVTPCNDTYSLLYNPKTKGQHIIDLNKMIRDYAQEKGFKYCDYWTVLVASDGLALKEEYRLYDNLHPNPAAYDKMESIIKPIIDSILN